MVSRTSARQGNPPPVIVGGSGDTRPHDDWLPEDGFAPTARLSSGRPLNRRQCCAWRKGRRARCTQPATAGKRVCRLHGGAFGSGRPPVHGRFSAAFGGIRDLYQRQLDADGADDPTDEIAVMRTAIELKVSCAMKGDSPKFRAEVLAAFERVASATPPEQQSPDFRALGELLRAGVGTDAALREVFDMADRTADRTTQLRRVRVAEMKVYTEAHIALMLKVFVETVREHTDVQTALRVATALDRRLALAASNSGPPRGSGEG